MCEKEIERTLVASNIRKKTFCAFRLKTRLRIDTDVVQQSENSREKSQQKSVKNNRSEDKHTQLPF